MADLDLDAIATRSSRELAPVSTKVIVTVPERDALVAAVRAARSLLDATEDLDPTVMGTGACAAWDQLEHHLAPFEADQ